MRSAVLLILAGAMTLGCAQSTTAHAQPTSRVVRYTAGSDAESAIIEVRGVQITIEAPVANGLSFESQGAQTKMLIGMNEIPPLQPGEDPANRFWLRGRPILVSDGHLRIGSQDYGAVAAGDAVLVDAAGVHVGGTLRGERPK